MGSKLPAYMAVVTTSFLAAVEGDCRGAILARLSAFGHRSALCRVLDAEHPAERRFDPMLCQPGRLPARIRWIGERHIVSQYLERFRERECRLPMRGRELGGTERFDVFLESPKALRIFFHEISGNGSAGERVQAERART